MGPPMSIRVIITAFVAVLWVLAPAAAQTGLRNVPLGYCSLSTLTTSTGLSSCSAGIPANAGYAVICAYSAGVVWRDDGQTPTATPGTGGQALASGQCMSYNGTFSAIQFIQQAAGAVIGINFWRNS